MKKLALLISLILYFALLKLSAQDYGNKVDPLKLCVAIQSNNFISDVEAENALDRILSVIGASKRFVLQPCDNINNAVAVSYKGVRYILYDKEFMNSVSSGNNWSNLFILAHEVGHHINGHSLDLVLYAAEAVEVETLVSRRQQELEADEFAGFILGKLGASLTQSSQAINLLATNNDDTYSSHPSKSKRLAAISIGHNKGLGNEKGYEILSKPQIAEVEMTAEKVLEIYLNAIGGVARVADINTAKINMNANVMGTALTIAFVYDSQNSRYGQKLSISGDVMQKTTIANGKGSMSVQGNTMEMTPAQLAEAQLNSYLFPEALYKSLGYSVKFDGLKDVDGKQAYKVIISNNTGAKLVNYYAKDSGLKIKYENPVSGDTYYGDYQMISGVLLPMSWTIKSPQIPVPLEAKVTNIQINVLVRETDFN